MTAILDEIQYLTSFNHAISRNLARSVSDMMGSILVDMANITLIRRDDYLATVRYGVKEETLLALRTSPVHTDRLFDEELIKRAEVELTAQDAARANRGRNRPQSATYTSRAGPLAPSPGPNRSIGSGPRNARKRPRKPDAQSGHTKPSFKGGKGFSFK